MRRDESRHLRGSRYVSSNVIEPRYGSPGTLDQRTSILGAVTREDL